MRIGYIYIKRESYICLCDALRRADIYYQLEGIQSLRDNLTTFWAGLGFKTGYQQAIDEGYFEWIGKPPVPRTMGWLHLTDKGAAVIREWWNDGYRGNSVKDFLFPAPYEAPNEVLCPPACYEDPDSDNGVKL